MKGFIEVRYNETPILVSMDNILAVNAGREYTGHRECTLFLARSIPLAQSMSNYIYPDESYDEIKRRIEEATK